MNDDAALRGPLWSWFRELRTTVEAANAGDGDHPFRRGDFEVHAAADEVELTLRDVSEEDAVLIASELRSLGATARLVALADCPGCGHRGPAESPCPDCASERA